MSARVRKVGFVAAAVLLGLTVGGANAQRNQAIYPAYDGFMKNPDGSFTLAFAYFSHNAEVVEVPPGPNNSFSPNPTDRMQPTVFKPGHWRFQCVMVVNPDFDGKMIWTLTYAGTTTGTSQRMMQSNWNLVEGAEELGKIDYKSVPRGVCLNRAPIVRVLGSGRGAAKITGAVGEQMSLFGSVNDEGLPRTSKLQTTWKMASGPAPVTFENPQVARTHATFSAPGTYQLELSATDGELSSTARVEADISAAKK